ncbi:MAG: hypothetical protein H0W83_06400 [Planctomycetes bacterium]|nr:hypothetical protein [Planctomycetota bacterium]
MLILRVLVLAVVACWSMAEDIVLGAESTIEKDKSGKFLVISDPRNKAEYMINVDRVVFVKAANQNDNNSFTEIKLGLTDKDSNSTVIKVQQRVIPYEQIKQALLK